MARFVLNLIETFECSTSYEVEADTPEEALRLTQESEESYRTGAPAPLERVGFVEAQRIKHVPTGESIASKLHTFLGGGRTNKPSNPRQFRYGGRCWSVNGYPGEGNFEVSISLVTQNSKRSNGAAYLLTEHGTLEWGDGWRNKMVVPMEHPEDEMTFVKVVAALMPIALGCARAKMKDAPGTERVCKKCPLQLGCLSKKAG